MTRILIGKLLRDMRTGFVVVWLLLFAFELLWARVTFTVSDRLLSLPNLRGVFPEFEKALFDGPGRIVQTMMGGDQIDVRRAIDMLSIGYVHPVIQTILCIWAIGRASGALAGEIDRGTMELLLAQPIPRRSVVLAHFLVDLGSIPLLGLAMWLGTWCGTWLVGLQDHANPDLRIDPARALPALLPVALLLFGIAGMTMWQSAAGRFRWRVLGTATLLVLLMFLVNIIGQLWDPARPFRPLTIFYWFQPQPMVLQTDWYASAAVWGRMAVLLCVGVVGYGMAWWTFCRRDLPAPL